MGLYGIYGNEVFVIKKKILLLLSIVLIMGAMNAYAGSVSYVNTVQPYCWDLEVMTHSKTTDYDIFYHRLDSMPAPYDAVYAWMETPLGTNLTSPSNKFNEGVGRSISFYSSNNLSIGDKVTLNMENADFVGVSVNVTGYCNYY